MQIDFHFATTYAVARIAGLSDADARIVAYSAQYVDDSTTSGFLRFDNGMRYYRQATAHPPIDLANMNNDVAGLSWLPFHFLPGNDGLETPAPVDAGYRKRLICRPDSPVARAMMADVIGAQDKPWALHRLGIAGHVFVDTFAHQGFVGERDGLNEVTAIETSDGVPLDKMHVPAVGHGQVNSYPDHPFRRWRYTNSEGASVVRDNPATFLQAADRLCQEFQRYVAQDAQKDVPGLGAALNDKFAHLFSHFTDDDGEVRLAGWLNALKGDYFGFGSATPAYVGKGQGSWKHDALGDNYLRWLETATAAFDNAPPEQQARWRRIGAAMWNSGVHQVEALADHFGVEVSKYSFDPAFLQSDYKHFHDAAEAQRYAVFKTILPRFGIIAA